MYSLIIPVYKNEEGLPKLLGAIERINQQLENELEVVFVDDGSPDGSALYLNQNLKNCSFKSQLVALSRNFGSFAAIRAGIAHANGQYFAVMAADLQEPPELVINFFNALRNNEADVVMGSRVARQDPLLSRVLSNTFWNFYRRLIQKDVPKGGVDIFGCNQLFRKQLLALEESNSSLVSLLFWLGFRRKYFAYERRVREHGKSSWSFRKKLKYLSDSMFSFTDLPIKILIWLGGFGLVASFLFGSFLLFAHLSHWVDVPGYTTTILLILLITALNAFSMGVVGSYVWRTFENSKKRPLAIVMYQQYFSNEDRS